MLGAQLILRPILDARFGPDAKPEFVDFRRLVLPWPGSRAQLPGGVEELPNPACTFTSNRNSWPIPETHARIKLTEDYGNDLRRHRGRVSRCAAKPSCASGGSSAGRWRSLEEAADRLFTFTRLDLRRNGNPARTTNAIERLNEEFRRRVKTQTVLPCAETLPMLLWALLASGQIQMREGRWLGNPLSAHRADAP